MWDGELSEGGGGRMDGGVLGEGDGRSICLVEGGGGALFADLLVFPSSPAEAVGVGDSEGFEERVDSGLGDGGSERGG